MTAAMAARRLSGKSSAECFEGFGGVGEVVDPGRVEHHPLHFVCGRIVRDPLRPVVEFLERVRENL